MDRFKIQYHKGSIDHFQDIMKQYLDGHTETINADIAIEHLISALQKSSGASFPVKEIITSKKHKPWNEDMKQLLIESSEIDIEWKSSGCAGSPDKLFQQRKVNTNDC